MTSHLKFHLPGFHQITQSIYPISQSHSLITICSFTYCSIIGKIGNLKFCFLLQVINVNSWGSHTTPTHIFEFYGLCNCWFSIHANVLPQYFGFLIYASVTYVEHCQMHFENLNTSTDALLSTLPLTSAKNWSKLVNDDLPFIKTCWLCLIKFGFSKGLVVPLSLLTPASSQQ